MNKSCVILILFCSVIKARSLFKDGVSNCYWTLRDQPRDQRVVHSVWQECGEGAVTWKNPFGGIEAVFKKPLHPSLEPFVDQQEKIFFCYRIQQSYTQVKVDREVFDETKIIFKNISSEDCLEVEDFKLYAEAVPNTISNIIGDFTFKYIWRAKSPFEKCQMCSPQEINFSFCSSQLVSLGKINYRDDNSIAFHITNTTSSSEVLSSINQSILMENLPDNNNNRNLFRGNLLADKQHTIDFVHDDNHHRNHHQHKHHHRHHHQHHHSNHPSKKPHKTVVHHHQNIHKRASKQHGVTQHRNLLRQHKRQKHQQKLQKHQQHAVESTDGQLTIPIQIQQCHLHTILSNAKKTDSKSIEYLLTGNLVLGKLSVQCIMEENQFKDIWEKLVKNNENLCGS